MKSKNAIIKALASVALAAVPAPSVPGQLVGFETGYPPGAIFISQSERTLYFVMDARKAMAYPVAVPKPGKEWSGAARVAAKFVEPAWSPPDVVMRDHSGIADVVPGGSPQNPMGERAILLDRDEIAIHGTTRAMRASIGRAASYGCIRMRNEDVIDLYNRVAIGAPVIMTR